MNNSGAYGREDRPSRPFADAIRLTRPLFDGSEQGSDAEPAELERLIGKFPRQAREILDGHGFIDGSGSPP